MLVRGLSEGAREGMTGSDRVAIVTGGSQGIGLATVQAFAARGMSVVAAARDRSRLDEAIAALDPAHRDRASWGSPPT